MVKMIDVVAGIISHEGKILIAKRKPGTHLEGFWEFPGGKIEKGETPEQSLTRELKEELSIHTVTNGFVAESIFDYGSKTIRLLAYSVAYLSGEIVLDSHDEIRWVSPERISEYKLAPADLPILEAFILEHKELS